MCCACAHAKQPSFALQLPIILQCKLGPHFIRSIKSHTDEPTDEPCFPIGTIGIVLELGPIWASKLRPYFLRSRKSHTDEPTDEPIFTVFYTVNIGENSVKHL